MKTEVKYFLTGVCALLLVGFGPEARGAVSFGNLPLRFEGSSGQEFVARGLGSVFTVSPAGAGFTLTKPNGESANCLMQFVGANQTVSPAGLQPTPGKINRFNGSQPQNWQTGLATYAQVLMKDVYPGINVVFYGNQNRLEYDFKLDAGADASQIAIRFSGAQKLSLAADGSLVIKVNAGEIVQHAPVAYQTINGSRREVRVAFRLLDRHTATFDLGNYDHGQPLVIDPQLTYSTYFGGNYGDLATAIAVNKTDGSIYIAGQTYSTQVSNNVPLSSTNAFQKNYRGGRFNGDAFVARFDSTGTNLIYATYLGGANNDTALALAVNAAGNAFIAGFTDSTEFPTTNALYNRIRSQRLQSGYPVDAFVTELSPAGDALVYSTYLGGKSTDVAEGLALDGADNAYVTGYTYSDNFPVTPGAFQTKLACKNTFYNNANAFLTVIAAGGGTNSLLYSTYLGGTNFDAGNAIAFNNNKVFVAGYTTSTNFPTTNNYLTGFTNLNGVNRKNTYRAKDAFVTAFDASSTTNLSVLYSTFLGGTNNDVATGIAADATGNAFVVGFTTSTNFPYTTTNVPGLTPAFVHTNDFIKHPASATNGFLTQIKWDGTSASIGYSTMFGGRGANVANGVALDDATGNVYVIGSATCTNFPVTADLIPPLSSTNSSKKQGSGTTRLSDVVIMVFNQDASALLFSAYLGGKQNDYGNAIALDSDNNVYLAGLTTSTNFPTVNPWKSYRSGSNDMFIAKISADVISSIFIVPPTPQIAGSPKVAGYPAPLSSDITLRWKMFSTNGQLESSTDMTGTNWHAVRQPPGFTNGWYQVHLPATNGVEFFRLRRP